MWTGVVHADLEHAERACDGQPRERQRDAPVVVERFLGGVRRSEPRENGPQHLLRPRLADATRHRDDARRRSGPRCLGNIVEAGQRIGDAQESTVAGLSLVTHVDEGRGGLRRERVRDEVVAVTHIAKRDEEIARFERA